MNLREAKGDVKGAFTKKTNTSTALLSPSPGTGNMLISGAASMCQVQQPTGLLAFRAAADKMQC